jgi:hypothetical protein
MRKVLIQNMFWCKTALATALDYCNSIKPKNEQINVIEFGVYTGDSIRMTDEILKQYQRPRFLLGIDSFQGLPEEKEGIDRFEHYKKGGFGDVFTKTCAFGDATILKKWFSDLELNDVSKYGINHFDIVHMDCDLYISTIQAYEFLLSNNLIGPNTLVVYDEFKSTKRLYAGGECLAHQEITNKYKVEFEEFFRNQYYDELNDLEFWQNSFLIKNVGNKADEGLITIENNK